MSDRCDQCPVPPELRCPGPCQWAASGNPVLVRSILDRSSPGLAERLVGFARAATSHVAAGSPEVDDATHDARLAICGACEHFLPGPKCRLCGCHLEVKTRWADQSCPIGKWTATA